MCTAGVAPAVHRAALGGHATTPRPANAQKLREVVLKRSQIVKEAMSKSRGATPAQLVGPAKPSGVPVIP